MKRWTRTCVPLANSATAWKTRAIHWLASVGGRTRRMKLALSRKIAYALFLILAPILAVVVSARFGTPRVAAWSLLVVIGFGLLTLLQSSRPPRPRRVPMRSDSQRARLLPVAPAIHVAKASWLHERGVMSRARRKRVHRVLATISEKYTLGGSERSPAKAAEPREPTFSSATERAYERRQGERRRSERRRAPEPPSAPKGPRTITRT